MDHSRRRSCAGPESAGGSEAEAAVPRIDARRLFNDAREVVIEHEGQEYRLRRTYRGKLILTK